MGVLPILVLWEADFAGIDLSGVRLYRLLFSPSNRCHKCGYYRRGWWVLRYPVQRMLAREPSARWQSYGEENFSRRKRRHKGKSFTWKDARARRRAGILDQWVDIAGWRVLAPAWRESPRPGPMPIGIQASSMHWRSVDRYLGQRGPALWLYLRWFKAVLGKSRKVFPFSRGTSLSVHVPPAR